MAERTRDGKLGWTRNGAKAALATSPARRRGVIACLRCTGETGMTSGVGDKKDASETTQVATMTAWETTGSGGDGVGAEGNDRGDAVSGSLIRSDEQLLFLSELDEALRPGPRTLCRRGRVCLRARKLAASSSAVSQPWVNGVRRLRAIVKRVAAESDSPHSLGSGDDRELHSEVSPDGWAAKGGQSERRLSKDESAS